MTLKDIYRFAADNGVTLHFKAIGDPMPMALEIIAQKENYRYAKLIPYDSIDDEKVIEHFMERIAWVIKKYTAYQGVRLCETCGNRTCKDAYDCPQTRESIKDCIENGRYRWIPDY